MVLMVCVQSVVDGRRFDIEIEAFFSAIFSLLSNVIIQYR